VPRRAGWGCGAVVHPRQRAHAVPAGLAPERAQVGELHVGPGLDRPPRSASQVVAARHAVEQRAPSASRTRAGGRRRGPSRRPRRRTSDIQFERMRREVPVQRRVAWACSAWRQIHRRSHQASICGTCAPARRARLARGLAVHATGHRAGAVHALAGRSAGSPPGRTCAAARPGARSRGAPRPRRRCCVRPTSLSKPNSRSGEQVEEVQRVRLQDLPVVHQPAQCLAPTAARRGRPARSIALLAARWCDTGQMPHSRCTITGTSQ
jgi:hypothetical protein